MSIRRLLRWPAMCDVVVVLSLAILTACGADSPEHLMASAKEYVAKREYSAAIIQLKNALRSEPNNGAARLLIAEAYLGSRDPVSAEKELRRALELNQPHEKTLPMLARALLEQGKHDEVISEIEKRDLFDPPAVASAKTTLGMSYAAKGNPQRARGAYQAALAAVPGYPRARLGQAIITAGEGKADEAMAQVEQIIASDPQFADAHGLKSDLYLAKGQREEAKKSLTQALQADGRFLPARFSLISVLIDEGAFEQAAAQIAQTRKVVPHDLLVTYFDGLLAYRTGDMQKARDHSLQVLRSMPTHVPSLVLAGAAELKLNQLVTAESYLRQALALAPGHAAARRSLVSVQLRMGMPVQANETLKPLLAQGVPKDPQILILAGETLLANGKLKEATAYYEAASLTEDAQKATARTRLGQIALATGSTEQGFRELEAASEIDAGNYQADLSLITGHLRRRELDKAMTAAQALERKQPKNPLSFQMYGLVNLAKRDFSAARIAFEKALELQPSYLPAALRLGMLDIADKRPERARSRYEAMITKDPKNERILLALADLQARAGDTASAIGATLQRAVETNPQSVPARLALINFHLGNKDHKAALSAAQNASAASPNDPRLLDALGVAQESAGEMNHAIETYNRLAALSPKSPQPLYRLVTLHVRQKETERAVAALRKVEKLLPKARNVVPQLVQIYLAANRPEDALKEARALQEREPKFAGAFALEADIHIAQKRWVEAEKAYREVLKLERTASPAAIGLHSVLIAEEKTADADAFARKWIVDNPKDAAMRLYLADRDRRARNYKSAAAHYQSVIAQAPDNGAVLNNLAWVLGELRDPKAIDYAERAVKMSPNNPAALDTLGVLLVEHGDAKAGVQHLERATKIAPNALSIRLHYAKGLIKLGRKDEARKEIEALQATKEDFQGKAAIADLLKSL